jgi:uncharacterized DUF497 family protein
MRILPKAITFQWDQGSIRKNLIKHNVAAQEAEEIFVRKPFYIKQDTKHSTPLEQRYSGLGRTKNNRLLYVAFTIRNEKIRIISVRDMKRIERSNYEKA